LPQIAFGIALAAAQPAKMVGATGCLRRNSLFSIAAQGGAGGTTSSVGPVSNGEGKRMWWLLGIAAAIWLIWKVQSIYRRGKGKE